MVTLASRSFWDRQVSSSVIVPSIIAFVGLSLGGILDVQLTNRYLVNLIRASTAATYPIDGGTAYHYLDSLILHTVAYGFVLMSACGAGLLMLAPRRPSSTVANGVAASARRSSVATILPTAASLFLLAILSGGLLDRALTKWRFARENIASHVSADTVLQPFYAYDAVYQHLALIIGFAALVLWLGGVLIGKRERRPEKR